MLPWGLVSFDVYSYSHVFNSALSFIIVTTGKMTVELVLRI